MNDGLISNNVKSICQDSLGFIWIATEEGLSSFDSREFQNYSTEDGLLQNNIHLILADRFDKGSIWILYEDGGLDKYKQGKFTHISKNFAYGKDAISTIYEDSDSTVWCGTENSVFFIKGDKVINADDNGRIKFVNSISQDNKGNILIAAASGLFTFNKLTKTVKRVTFPKPYDCNGIVSIYPDKDSTEWFLKSNGQLIKRKDGLISGTVINRNVHFFNLSSSPDNKFIYISSDAGLYKIEKAGLKVYSIIDEQSGLSNNNVICAFIDREGVLWFGLNNNGISKLTFQNLHKFKKDEYFSTTFIDSNSHIWILENNSLLEIWKDKTNKWLKSSHKFKNNLNDSEPNFVFYNDNKFSLFKSSGIIKEYRIENSSPLSANPSVIVPFRNINIQNKIRPHNLFKSIEDSYGNLWISVLDLGVIVVGNKDPVNIKTIYTDKNGLPDNSIRTIYEDSKKNIWLGGYDHGLAFFSKDKVLKDLGEKFNPAKVEQKLYTVKDNLPGNDIRAITENNRGAILIGTRYGGLGIYENNKFRTLSRETGLLSNGIWDIWVNKNNSFWIATQDGIQKVDKGYLISSELNEELPNIPFFNVTGRNNLIAFASHSYIYIYEQDNFREANNSPIYFNKPLVNGKEYYLNNHMVLTNDQNNITFEFTLVKNVENKTRIYYYRLLNVEKSWHKLVNKNSVTYASLKPGKYKFEVNAGNLNNVFNNTPASISFEISQPFYLEWWFISSIILVALISLYLYMNLRNRRRLEIEKIRMKIAEDLHDEIGSGLTKIAVLSEHALKEQEEITSLDDNIRAITKDNSIVRVGKIARDLVDQMIDVIWSIDPQYDSLNDFVFSFKNFAYETCEAKNIELDIRTNNIENIKVNAQVKRNLQLIAKESIINAIKYSGCSKIIVYLGVKNRNIIFSVEDNGSGFEREKIIPGKGLLNIEKNTRQINGTFSIKSRPEQGSKVEIIFPIHR